MAATALLGAMGIVPAQADGSRTLTGPTTGDPDVFLTYVGCDSLFAPATAPQSRLNLGPYSAPLGERSLGLVPSARGSASGPYARFDSLKAISSSLSVASTSGTTGVSYVMSITPSNPVGTAWSGRAPLSAPAGSWSVVDAASLTYDWTLVDLDTLAPVAEAGKATATAFAVEHGDGTGFVVSGFGCDGRPFNIDAVRASGSTFDFEGVSLTTAATVDDQNVKAGDSVAVSGRVTDGGGRVTGDPLVLESRTPGGAWSSTGKSVLSDAKGVAHVDVTVKQTTEFRWHRPASQYADEGWSDPVTVTVTAAEAKPEPKPEPKPKPKPDVEQKDTTDPKADEADDKAADTKTDAASDQKSDQKPDQKSGETSDTAADDTQDTTTEQPAAPAKK